MHDVPAKRYQDKLSYIKNHVRNAYEYFKHNYDRYNEFRRFVFETSLRNEDITLLQTLSMPQLEFNILEAYISRLLGEFSKQEPDISVNADDENTADPAIIKLLEQHLRHTLTDSANHHTRYEVYKDLLSGGFSVLKVCTEYANPMSFNQVIKIERAFDPTLCGFDQLARYSHKGDGRFCFELFPMNEDDFREQYPDINISELSFRRDFSGFNWSYLNDTSKILVVADYYEKKKERVSIVQLRDGRTMTQKEYKKMLNTWAEFEAPPAIMGKPRMTELERIVRYRCIDNQVIEYEETDYTKLPLIFVDGNSIMVKTPKNGNIRQITRPYVYHAKSAQRMKNYAGISIANYIENTTQHKFIIKKEALPKEEEWLQAIKDVQKPSNIVVNAFYEEDPNQQIPDPIREVQHPQYPPEALQAFTGADSLMQNILGSYDASLGINNNQLSGIAIVEAASQSNAAAMPYIVGYLQGFQRAAEIYVDLLPKYYKTPRTLPIMDEEGFRSYVKINGEDGFNMYYDANALNVVVKAGASFTIQKSRTIMMIKEMMGMSPLFAQFISSKGINFVLDNMEGRGIEQLKSLVNEWVQEMQQQAAQAQANDPNAMKNQIMMEKIQSDRELKEQSNHIKIMDAQMKHEAQLVKALAEQFRAKTDVMMKRMDFEHKQTHEMLKLSHEHAKNIASHIHNVKKSRQEIIQ